MKKLFVLIFFLPFFVQSQVIDNFNDGDFSNNPIWLGDIMSFNIESSQLHSNGSSITSDTIYLSTSNAMIDSTEWNFLIDLKFAPSSINYVRVYLVASDSNLISTPNAYYIQIQGTQGAVNFYKKQAGVSTLLFTGSTSFSTSITEMKIRLKVCRKNNGIWNFYSDKTGGYNFVSEGNALIENSITNTSYFGFYCKYSTSSRYNKYYFDDVFIGNIIADTTKPIITSVMAKSINSLDVLFNEEVDGNTSQNCLNYIADNGLGNPVLAIKDAVSNSIVHLQFAQDFPANGISHISIKNVEDMSANVILPVNFPFAFPIEAQPNDVVINEVLFNPKDDGEDFVEIYNRSQKNIDLTKFMIATYDLTSNKLKSMYVVSPDYKILFAGEYLVLTRDPDKVKQQFYAEAPLNFVKMTSMPSFNNDMGVVVLTRPDSTIIDRFDYNEAMQFPLLVSVEGVSLERVSSEKPSQDKQNWHSAAQSVGFGTPTYKNSQYSTFLYLEDPITILPEIFSPDDDGYNDILSITYQFSTPGYIANVIIYDAKGRLIKTLIKNELLGIKGSFSWDGIDENNQKANIGIYIVYVEIFDTSGNVKSYKKTAVLGGKF
ncbi:MAG: lamin tail domain-containing protein [Bacteroidetes bacterium]|nr:lamin tail domain-containing protein [Bacteroidota bacterium]